MSLASDTPFSSWQNINNKRPEAWLITIFLSAKIQFVIFLPRFSAVIDTLYFENLCKKLWEKHSKTEIHDLVCLSFCVSRETVFPKSNESFFCAKTCAFHFTSFSSFSLAYICVHHEMPLFCLPSWLNRNPQENILSSVSSTVSLIIYEVLGKFCQDVHLSCLPEESLSTEECQHF